MNDAFNCCFVFLGLSLDHVRKILTSVRVVVRLTKAGTHHAFSPAPRTQETCC